MTPDVSGMTQAVFSETALETSKNLLSATGGLHPGLLGDYHIALHLTSKPGSGDFGFYSFTITDETTAPEAVKDLAIHAATDGSLKATLVDKSRPDIRRERCGCGRPNRNPP